MLVRNKFCRGIMPLTYRVGGECSIKKAPASFPDGAALVFRNNILTNELLVLGIARNTYYKYKRELRGEKWMPLATALTNSSNHCRWGE